MKHWIYGLALLLVVGCSQQPSNQTDLLTDSLVVIDSINNDEKLKKETQEFIDTLQQRVLDQFNEPDLRDSGGFAYRFYYIDYAGPLIKGVKIYSIYDDSSRYFATFKYFDIDSAGHQDSLVMKRKEISESEWEEILVLAYGSYFWSMETYHVEMTGFTDDYWVLEGRSTSKRVTNQRNYHLVVRTTPYDGSFKSTCMKIQEICER